MDFLDFLPPKATVEKLIIIGPYPSYEYIKGLINDKKKGLSIKNIFIVVDESWDVQKLEKDGFKIIKVRANTSDAIVHAKMYYVKYKCQGKKQISFITGSANASKNGMSKNSETLSFYRLSLFKTKDENEQKDICNYFNDLRKGKDVNELTLTHKTGSKIFLPSIKIAQKQISFSSWIRSGFLFYPYERDPNFGIISISLNPKLPDGVKWGKNSRFKEESEGVSSLRFPYLKLERLKKQNDSIKKYSVETSFGFWISKECFEKCECKIFHQKFKKELKDYVDEIDLGKLKNEVWTEIENLKQLNSENKTVTKCLSQLERDKVYKTIESRIKLDKRKAYDAIYCKRFERGFEKNNIPRFESEQWEAFVRSWFDYCLMKGGITQSKSKLAKKVFRCLKLAKKTRAILNNYGSEGISNYFLYKDWSTFFSDYFINYFKVDEDD